MNKSIFSDKTYTEFLKEVVYLVQSHRIYAIQTVQTINIQLYWSIGELILHRQKEYGWGKSIVNQLSKDLTVRIGDGISWSSRNLWFMRQLVLEYSNVNQLGSYLEMEKLNQLDSVMDIEEIKELVCKVPWKHNILIIQKVKNPKARLFYLQTTFKNKYSRSVLLHQINADAYGVYLANPTQHNFETALPEHLLEQTSESIKSVYSLDFLDINKPVSERQLELSMVEKVKRVMMELGYGFCFIANQYQISLGDKDYYIDLLFYHRILKCLVVVELKVVEFQPEFVGKLDFYLQLVDEQLKQEDDKPSIGILLVPNKDQLEVEYALRVASKPIGIAQYKLSKQLPEDLKGKLPTVDDFNEIL